MFIIMADQLVAAVPFRMDHTGVIQVLLITNGKGAWIVPKGGIDEGHTPQGAALQEAWEEAGAKGYIAGEPLGYWNTVRRYDGEETPARAALLPMVVERLTKSWPEEDRRSRRWASIREACELVQEADIRAALQRLARQVRGLLRHAA